MGLKIWLNEGLVDEDQARISVFDRGVLYGDGVFEGIRVYNGKVFEHQAHIDRLYVSARTIRLKIPLDPETMKDRVEQTVQANGISDGYVRLVVTRGIGDLSLDPTVCENPQIFIIAATIQLYPQELYEKGLNIVSSSVMRNHPLCLPPQVKSLNYLNNILAKQEACDRQAPEAIMYNHLGFVAEATGDNVFIVRDGVIITPPNSDGSLTGVTQAVVIRLAQEAGYDVRHEHLTRFDLYGADEMFLTGTAAEVIGVSQMDHQPIGGGTPGPVTRDLKARFEAYARS